MAQQKPYFQAVLQNGVLFVFRAGLCIRVFRVCAVLCCPRLDWGKTLCLRGSLSLRPLPREFSVVLSSLEVTVWRRKAGKGPYPVSLLVPPWQFLLWERCENRRLFSSHYEKITVVPDTSVEHRIERSLCALLLFLYLSVDFVQPRGNTEMKVVCLYAWKKFCYFSSSF